MKPSNVYQIKDNKLMRKNPLCPRCGPGTFMANHGDRFTCGKCGYTKWKSNK